MATNGNRWHSNTTLVKVKSGHTSQAVAEGDIQIQHLLKLNFTHARSTHDQ